MEETIQLCALENFLLFFIFTQKSVGEKGGNPYTPK